MSRTFPTERQARIVKGVLHNGNMTGKPRHASAREVLDWIRLVEQELDDPEGGPKYGEYGHTIPRP